MKKFKAILRDVEGKRRKCDLIQKVTKILTVVGTIMKRCISNLDLHQRPLMEPGFPALTSYIYQSAHAFPDIYMFLPTSASTHVRLGLQLTHSFHYGFFF